MKKNKKPKLELGGNILDAYLGKSYLDIGSPDDMIYKSQAASAKAEAAAQSDPLANIFSIIGGLGLNAGSSMISSAVSKGTAGQRLLGNTLSSGLNTLGTISSQFAYGGQVGQGLPVEVEGDEVANLPNGQLLDFQGPSHSQGGIDVNLPGGTEVFSKRVKIDGVSLADREKKRNKRSVTLEQLLKANPTDTLLKATQNRTSANNEKEKGIDRNVQQIVNAIVKDRQNSTGNKYAYGGILGDPPVRDGGNIEGVSIKKQKIAPILGLQPDNRIMWNAPLNPIYRPEGDLDIGRFTNSWLPYVEPSQLLNQPSIGVAPVTPYVPESEDTDSTSNKTFNYLNNILGNGIGLGDAIGLYANHYLGTKLMQNTLDNRAGDTPNINPFTNFGREALNTIDKSKDYSNNILSQQLLESEIGRSSAKRQSRNNARGINTMRATDLAADMAANLNRNRLYSEASQRMLNILSNQANVQNQRDQAVMTGEGQRDLANRQDRDAFYSQMAQNIATKGRALQELGYDINQLKQRAVTSRLMAELSKHGITIDPNTGELSDRSTKNK